MSEAADRLASEAGVRGAVLLVDDDPVTLSGLSLLLKRRGVTIYEASTGAGAVESALAHRPEVLVLDNRLGKPEDMTGIDVIDALHAQSFYPTWILYSGFMELDLAVDAGRRDVFCVVQLPSIDIETPVMKALTAAREGQVSGWPILPVGQLPLSPLTSVGKGAGWILLACDSLDDLPSFPAWASFVNTNERRMRDLYEQLRLEPHHVKSFMRWFRALGRAHGDAENAIAEMTVGDPRTLKKLRDEAGLSSSDISLSLEQFLRSQTFLPVDHVLVTTLRSLTTIRNLPDLLNADRRIVPARQSPASSTNRGKGAAQILAARDSAGDLSTFPEWASFVGTSERRMRDLFKQTALDPDQVKWFVRVFRALAKTGGHVGNAVAQLNVGDLRTLKHLRSDAGLNLSSVVRIPLEQFLRTPRFVPSDHSMLTALRSLIATRNLPELFNPEPSRIFRRIFHRIFLRLLLDARWAPLILIAANLPSPRSWEKGSLSMSRLTNIVTTVGIVVLVGLVVEQRWTQYRAAANSRAVVEENTYQPGELIQDTPELSLEESSRTLLIGTASTCRFCTASMPFYNRLQQAAKTQGVKVVAYTAEDRDTNKRYLDAHGVVPDALVGALENRLLLYSTPSIVLVDKGGAVLKSWLGQLKRAQEDELLQLLKENAQ